MCTNNGYAQHPRHPHTSSADQWQPPLSEPIHDPTVGIHEAIVTIRQPWARPGGLMACGWSIAHHVQHNTTITNMVQRMPRPLHCTCIGQTAAQLILCRACQTTLSATGRQPAPLCNCHTPRATQTVSTGRANILRLTRIRSRNALL
jgi:hypothetical protein